MEPHIQYAQTSDGLSIAYSVSGKGPPFLYLPSFPINHMQAEWQITPETRPWYEALAQNRRLVRFDGRGTGLSDRNVTDFSLEARILDVEAIADHLQLKRFAVFGGVHYSPVAIAYAARNPERVSHLVLCFGYSRGTDYSQAVQVQATRASLDKDWTIYTETGAHALMAGWGESDLARRAARLFRESITQDAMRAFVPHGDDTDVTDLLPLVRVPTLVIHRQGIASPSVDVARGLASRIPGARSAVLEGAGASMLPWAGDVQAMLDLITDFLGDQPANARRPSPSGLRTILFTDLVGHSDMMSRLGDERGREVLREHERITREVLKEHGGTEVKTMGDGFMASFGSVTKAVGCAISLQRRFAEREGEPLSVRVGLNAGEPIEEEGDLFGATVILASRIAANADGGEILVSDNVRSLSSGKGFLFSDRGEFVAKGFEEPVRVFEVRWEQ